MRKFTIACLLAATAIPAMAAAQEDGGRHGRQHENTDKADKRSSGESQQRQNDQRQQQNDQRQRAQSERQAQTLQVQAARQQQGAQQDDRRAQFEQSRAARLQEQQGRQRNDLAARSDQLQAARQAQLEQRQAERLARGDQQSGDRDRGADGREADGRSRDERLQQYRAQTEQRRAQLSGQTGGAPGQGINGRDGRLRGGPGFDPNNAGRPAPENRDARFANRDHQDRNHDSRNRWTSNWRNDNRYDWQRYRNQHHSTFRIGFYFDPFGYSYNRFGVGSYLYPGYYQSNYWINDPWQYRLPPVYGSYRWVRYHNDALMIDTWTGEVVDVIYGFFW